MIVLVPALIYFVIGIDGLREIVEALAQSVRPSETPACGRQLEDLRRVTGGRTAWRRRRLPFAMELVGRGTFGQAAAPDVPMPLVLALALPRTAFCLP